MRALVSGSTGFSGGFLCAALRALGSEVLAVSQRVEAPGVRRTDLTSSAAWASVLRDVQPDHVFHLSGVTHTPELSQFALHNTAAAAALLDAALGLEKAPSSVLLVGSAAEYGIVPETALPVVETFPASPRMPYGATKHAQTRLGLEAARRGLRVVIARPSNIIGPGMPVSSALGTFARQLREIELGRRAPTLSVGDLGTSRDFVDVRDAAQAFLALGMHPSCSGVVNVSAGQHVTLRAILDQLIAAFGLQVTVEVDPARLRAVEVQKFSASSQRWHELLGPQALIPLADTVRAIVQHERAALS